MNIGECKGKIVAPESGKHGFGWDSIFVPDELINNTNGSQIPFSKMTMQEKSELSHRGKAVREFAAWLARNRDELYRRQQGEPALGHKGFKFVDKPNDLTQEYVPRSAEDSNLRRYIPLNSNQELD